MCCFMTMTLETMAIAQAAKIKKVGEVQATSRGPPDPIESARARRAQPDTKAVGPMISEKGNDAAAACSAEFLIITPDSTSPAAMDVHMKWLGEYIYYSSFLCNYLRKKC